MSGNIDNYDSTTANDMTVIDIIFLSMPLIFIILLFSAIIFVNIYYCKYKCKYERSDNTIKFDNSFIKNLNKKNKKNDIDKLEECSICLEGFADKNYVILNCNHIFHKKCVKTWINQNNQSGCPLCRDTVINISNNNFRSYSDDSDFSLYSD